MSFVPWCVARTLPPVDDGGKKTFVGHFWKEEIERKNSRKIVSLRVPGSVDYQKSSSAPGVIRICQEKHPQRKPRKKFVGIGFVVVPESSDFGAPDKRQSFEFQISTSSSVPSIKRCSLNEIEAITSPMEKNSRNGQESTQRGAEVYNTARHRGWAPSPSTSGISPSHHSSKNKPITQYKTKLRSIRDETKHSKKEKSVNLS